MPRRRPPNPPPPAYRQRRLWELIPHPPVPTQVCRCCGELLGSGCGCRWRKHCPSCRRCQAHCLCVQRHPV